MRFEFKTTSGLGLYPSFEGPRTPILAQAWVPSVHRTHFLGVQPGLLLVFSKVVAVIASLLPIHACLLRTQLVGPCRVLDGPLRRAT